MITKAAAEASGVPSAKASQQKTEGFHSRALKRKEKIGHETHTHRAPPFPVKSGDGRAVSALPPAGDPQGVAGHWSPSLLDQTEFPLSRFSQLCTENITLFSVHVILNGFRKHGCPDGPTVKRRHVERIRVSFAWSHETPGTVGRLSHSSEDLGYLLSQMASCLYYRI